MVKEMEQKQVHLLISSHEVMSHFCYAYSKALYKKLANMISTNSVMLPNQDDRPTTIAMSVANALCDQIGCTNQSVDRCSKKPAFYNILCTAAEFLAIFEA
jgi:hypothetical protein